MPFSPLFPSEASAGLAVFNELRVVDMLGKPTVGQIARLWIKDFVGSIFGALDPEAERRLVREFFMLISKKNWKSGLAGLSMLTAETLNYRDSAEFLVLAPTIEVANNSYKPARDAIKADERLDALFQVQDHLRTITHRVTGATLKVVAADSETVSGKKTTGLLVEELWMFGKKPGAKNMLIEAQGGLASRPEGFVIYVTTQSDEPPAGVFDEKLQYARGVRDGRIEDPQFLPVLYEFPRQMLKAKQERDPKNFYVTNPNLGASVDIPFLEREFKKAEVEGEASIRAFLAKHLNVEIGLALRSDRWAGADFWEAAGEPAVASLDGFLERCEVVTAGIDGGGLDDLLGLTLTGREKTTRRWLSWSHAWAHRIVLERRKDIASALLGFEKDGNLTIVDQPGDDVTAVVEVIVRVRDANLLAQGQAIGVDAAGISAIVDALTDPEGAAFSIEQIVAISQGWKLNGAIKTAERKVAGGELLHGATRLMAWCVGNARIVQNGNAISITKAVSGTAKIDPLMALFNAVSLMALNPAAPRKSVYESRGVRHI
ncbi:terminase large subunit [Pigmentiphaga litoralis]|uniref:terminase large subunit n=1 Tax=Pigmentiphaga litoralis TaxID=516702 RepID=UPI001E2E67E4|nr:terminase TerL endonuclease subunit [Pigmentiphaga litoralis]